MMDFFQHLLIKEKAIQRRLYQETILGTCNNKNSLIILPTGLGKTIIAVLISVNRLAKFPKSKIIFLAPTKPLVAQHYATYKSVLVLDEGLEVLTGSVSPGNREQVFKDAKILFYTPQTLQNDIITGIVSLQDVSLLIFDEAHRATGEYAYNFIADQYVKKAKHPLILGMTASPGANREKIDGVLDNLFIKNIEIRTEKSPDVKNYVQDIEMKWDRIVLPTQFDDVKTIIEQHYRDMLKSLKNKNYLGSYDISKISKQDLLAAQAKARQNLNSSSNPTTEDYELVANVAMAIRFSYMLELLGTQGLNSLLTYLDKIEKTASGKRSSRAIKELVNSSMFQNLKTTVQSLVQKGMDHPKYSALQKHLQHQFQHSKSSRVIVFTQYRVTAQQITKKLGEREGIKPVRFVGQQSKPGDKGLAQKEQLEILEQFKEGIYNVLVATSVAEEGLDIAECDLVIFYDVVPSEIRYVQRKGRTGRKSPGQVIILMAQKTRDEGYYWAAQRKQREMYRILSEIQELARKRYRHIDNGQTQIEKYVKQKGTNVKRKEINVKEKEINFEITVDHRESSSSLIKELVRQGFQIKSTQLPVGDYQIGNRILVERKTPHDFSSSITDGRLFKEIKDLKENSSHPLLLIEGLDLYAASTLKPEAIRGAFVSIMLDFKIPIINTKDGKESAMFFKTIARREMEKDKGRKIIPTRIEKTPQKQAEILEFVVAGLPGVNTIRAKNLLEKLETLENIFTAAAAELLEIEGIGKKLAERIRKLVTAKYNPEK